VNRLKLLIFIFCLALAVPLGYFVVQTSRSLEQEEQAELRFFADTLFDQVETELTGVVLSEEGRAVDEYTYLILPQGQHLTEKDREPYILGYLQNNPDGSLQLPLQKGEGSAPEMDQLVRQLQEVNAIFNSKRSAAPEAPEVRAKDAAAAPKKEATGSFADRYLAMSRSTRQRDHLGQEEKRVAQITPSQALNLSQSPPKRAQAEPAPARPAETERGPSEAGTVAGRRTTLRDEGLGEAQSSGASPMPSSNLKSTPEGIGGAREKTVESRLSSSYVPNSNEQVKEDRRDAEAGFEATSPMADRLRVEIDPMQSLNIDERRVLIFRRIVIGNQVYRQGFVIRLQEFMGHLLEAHFAGQPMARFTSLTLKALDQGREVARIQAGPTSAHPSFSMDRGFPRPFSFLRATLACDQIPRSPGRKTLTLMAAILAAVIFLGLLSIYQSARVVMDLSERRSRFVSSVTHEIKTPLTNIRMYIEMLEQGIAGDHERELDYFRILGSESARLGRLIGNVLEFSKLERKQRRLDISKGTLEEVVSEVQEVMQEQLRKEGFSLKFERHVMDPFPYDREAMIQIVINLVENSVKFGKSSPTRGITIRVRPEGKWVKVSVSDTGPGIPSHELKKIFDDFYRADNALTRSTKGTGIGLALVRKLVAQMGGSVTASNNEGPGCTITISLPARGKAP
jgi:signal transduction histidine kinase